METSALAATVVATSAQQTRDGFSVAALKIAKQSEQAVAGLVQQTAENMKAQTAAGVGGSVDKLA